MLNVNIKSTEKASIDRLREEFSGKSTLTGDKKNKKSMPQYVQDLTSAKARKKMLSERLMDPGSRSGPGKNVDKTKLRLFKPRKSQIECLTNHWFTGFDGTVYEHLRITARGFAPLIKVKGNREGFFKGLIEEKIDVVDGSIVGTFETRTAPVKMLKKWAIPGHGNKKDEYCGTVYGVNKCKESNRVQYTRRHCYRWDCPVCYKQTSFRLANRAFERLIARNQKIYHWVVSFSEDQDSVMMPSDVAKRRRQIYKMFSGGSLVFHPYRLKGIKVNPDGTEEIIDITNKKEDVVKRFWQWGPHFHIMSSVRYIDPTQLHVYHKKGVFLTRIVHDSYIDEKTNKKINVYAVPPEDITGKLAYEISHAGYWSETNTVVKNTVKGLQTFQRIRTNLITYFGTYSPQKLKMVEITVRVPKVCGCSECRQKKLPHRSYLEELEFEVDEEKIIKTAVGWQISSQVSLKSVIGINYENRKIRLKKGMNEPYFENLYKKIFPEYILQKIREKYVFNTTYLDIGDYLK
jgi:hypothetical protein